ncbi:MAG: 2,3-bisphosphoglycerate-independent phosphoglycerate mutase [Deltaproteobacteria bacterium HGW-Deltaproteobacteria-14]|jgi:2,3-bisphosphoglycerate-independent phosphoglycerate mutase|nr:MAG: 2,3-bisphosphoglycerate-independent phosphoglycerate mutase [Deltaproteobacteria bacterium HGW-Deltaproteobacteria-14]
MADPKTPAPPAVDPAWRLAPAPGFSRPKGPVVLVVMDGVGIAPRDEGNAWHLARTPFLDELMRAPVHGALAAHGTAVGMPSDADMGNSEVGHNALGAGRVFDQGAKLVQNAVDDGSLVAGAAWGEVIAPCLTGGTLHLIGLWSDGNVHSNIQHVYALIDDAVAKGVHRIRLHPLLDGRDVPETSALDYVLPLEARFAELAARGVDVAVGSGGGRMITTMDRYEADWAIVERGWNAHVHGQGRGFPSASAAIGALREEKPGLVDQYLPPFVVVDADGAPVGRIEDGDAVVFFNFRGDRAIEITRAFEAPEGDFAPFERGRVPRVTFAGMMQYDGDLQLPARFLVTPPAIDRTLGEYLAKNGLRQLALSETQKFGHVTYFFNGNNSEPFDEALERYVEVPSDKVDFSERPWMKAAELTDRAIAELDAFHPDFVRINYPNGDMVGHTGQLLPAIISMEALDLCLARLVPAVLERGGVCVITADHGNCEQMFQRDKKGGFLAKTDGPGFQPLTSHTLNPVPCVIVGGGAGERFVWRDVPSPGISNLAATCLNLLGLEAPSDYRPSVIAAR